MMKLLYVLFSLIFCPACLAATTYYVAAEGNDANAGDSASAPWRSLGRVNTADLKPGDTVLFRRGDHWREQLIPRRGDATGVITYGAYGEGAKPLFLGSVQKNRPEDWIQEGEKIWSTLEPQPLGECILANPGFDEAAAGWTLYQEGSAQATGARDTELSDTPPASYRIEGRAAGKRDSDLQFYTGTFPVTAGSFYCLTFRARCTQPFGLSMPHLMKAGPPWTSYATRSAPLEQPVDNEWKTYTHYYQAMTTASDARLTFFLGPSLPAGGVLHLDTFAFRACDLNGALMRDVGNIIFDQEGSCGVKVWNETEIREQGQYWYDEARHRVKLYSERNPGQQYSDIECAITRHIIDESNACYVVYDNLALKYGGAHGIGGGNTHHITVTNCDLSYIGGGDQMGGDRTVRYGNGIEFWGSAQDNRVERCRLWEIYDAALTNQSSGPKTPHERIVYRFNVIWNCEYSFEYWNRPEDSHTDEVYFENNTCVQAGYGWGHTQRPDPSGRHLCFYSSPAPASNIHIRNNIFCEAKGNAFYAPTWPESAVRGLDMDYNAWYQPEGAMVSLINSQYAMTQFGEYQAAWGKEPHSIIGQPLFSGASSRDYRLVAGSPCIDAGVALGLGSDFDGNAIPQGLGPDIGAYECK